MKNFREAVADTWGVPKDVVMNIPRITISGDKEIYIEGYKGVVSYTSDEICIAAGGGVVRIHGKGLLISAIRREDVLISGQFQSIEYEK